MDTSKFQDIHTSSSDTNSDDDELYLFKNKKAWFDLSVSNLKVNEWKESGGQVIENLTDKCDYYFVGLSYNGSNDTETLKANNNDLILTSIEYVTQCIEDDTTELVDIRNYDVEYIVNNKAKALDLDLEDSDKENRQSNATHQNIIEPAQQQEEAEEEEEREIVKKPKKKENDVKKPK